MKRLVVLALTAVSSLLSGCATYDEYSYYDRDGYYEDEYYGDRHVGRRYYYDEWGNRVYIDDYDVSHRYGAYYGSASWGYPDYVRYNYYYSALWPTYRYYYDPYWSPGFYYGVTYFPRTYFGLNVGWYSWPYYQAYSPYRYSYYDSYYDWHGHGHHGHGGHDGPRGGAGGNDGDPRFGSASNEAERLANMDAPRGSGFGYLRSTRAATTVLYGPGDTFPIGGSKTLRQSDSDRGVIVAAGITLHEALKGPPSSPYKELVDDMGRGIEAFAWAVPAPVPASARPFTRTTPGTSMACWRWPTRPCMPPNANARAKRSRA